MKPVAYMIWAPFTGPARFTTDHSAPEKTAQRADYTCTPLITERDALAAIEQAQQRVAELEAERDALKVKLANIRSITPAMVAAARAVFGEHVEDTDSDYRRILSAAIAAKGE